VPLEMEKPSGPPCIRLFSSRIGMLSPTRSPRLVEKIRIDLLPRNDITLNIWAFKSLSDDRNGVDIYRLSTYSVAGLHNNHC